MALETHRQRRPPRLGEPSGSAGGLKPDSANTAQEYLNNCRSFYSCIYCRTHLANHDELVSRSFQGNRSRAYLFNSVVNISCGAPVQRELNTGSHAVADIFCTNCGTTIGWKYEKAYEDSQKYKEGKFIIELVHVVRENRHLELDKRDTFKSLLAQQAGPAVIEQVATTSSFGWIGGSGISNHHNYQYRQRHHHNHQHQGSLSPPRPYSWSSSSASSSSTSAACNSTSPSSSSSSSSPSSSSSSPSPNNLRTRDARVRYNSSGQYEDATMDREDEDDQDEPEHEEALMFPFYDDLYGNRSSYSNLSTSLSYFQRRLRRSLQMASAPLQPLPPYDDWKQQAHRSPQPSGTCAMATISPGATNLARSSIAGVPSTSAATAAADQSDNDDQHANSGEIQFELEPEHGPSPASDCDRPRQGDASKSNGDMVATTSQDDEEFYDCCTDHDVA